MMGKLLPQRFTTATGLAHGSATLIARQVLANDEASEPTRIRKTRVLLVDRTVGEVFMVYRIMYELAVCSDGMTEAQPRSFRQNRPASEYII